MGIPLRRGRCFTAQDAEDTARVLIINEAMTRQYFAGEEPLGKRVKGGNGFMRVGNGREVHRAIVQQVLNVATPDSIILFSSAATSRPELRTSGRPTAAAVCSSRSSN